MRTRRSLLHAALPPIPAFGTRDLAGDVGGISRRGHFIVHVSAHYRGLLPGTLCMSKTVQLARSSRCDRCTPLTVGRVPADRAHFGIAQTTRHDAVRAVELVADPEPLSSKCCRLVLIGCGLEIERDYFSPAACVPFAGTVRLNPACGLQSLLVSNMAV